jgi:maltooligosyltrehalose synthase
LPEADWFDVFTGQHSSGGTVRVADLLAALPVALLRRT